jgi:hypothetical protein
MPGWAYQPRGRAQRATDRLQGRASPLLAGRLLATRNNLICTVLDVALAASGVQVLQDGVWRGGVRRTIDWQWGGRAETETVGLTGTVLYVVGREC